MARRINFDDIANDQPVDQTPYQPDIPDSGYRDYTPPPVSPEPAAPPEQSPVPVAPPPRVGTPEKPPPNITPVPDTGGGGQNGPIDNYLLNLLQGGMDRDAAIEQARRVYNIPAGVDGSPLWYPGNQTIGLKNSYLAYVDGKWSLVPRGPEGGGGGNTSTYHYSPTPFNSDFVATLGNDPFSQLITDKLSELIKNNGRLGPDTEALNLENVRQAADRARTAEYSGALSTLANRGLLPENTPGGQGGLALDSLARIERNDIAPNFSAAVRDYLVHGADQANSNLLAALQQGTSRQGMLSNVALQMLAQNTAFNEFLATFGLQRDQVLAQLQQGNNSALIQLLMQFLVAAQTSAGGHF